ncbi:hypothetical protein EAE99_001308 [Botrytis elliptica]|nr:hypothetical protein EAE99_001308 [Botrytis elliptica]
MVFGWTHRRMASPSALALVRMLVLGLGTEMGMEDSYLTSESRSGVDRLCRELGYVAHGVRGAIICMVKRDGWMGLRCEV